MDAAGAPVEIELKLAIAPERVAALRAHPALRDVVRGACRSDRLVAVYHDTPDRRLLNAGVALRVRRLGASFVMTVKGPPAEDAASGIVSRPEVEWPVAGDAIDTMRLATTPWRAVFAKALRRGPLAPVFTTRFTRTSWPLSFPDGTTATFALDRGEIEAGVRRAPISEIEIELEAGDPARLLDLAERLAADLPLSIEPRSKAERGFALAEGATIEPSRARDIAHAAGASAGSAIAATIAECLRQVERNAVGLREASARDPEWVHQLRIGVRRLRSCLALAEGIVAPNRIESLRNDTRWTLDALGPARDLDVFAGETLPRALADLERSTDAATRGAAAVRSLARRAAARRRAAHADALACAASGRFTRFLLAVSRAAAEAPAGPASGEPAARLAARILERRAARLARAGARLARAGSEERHAVRIAAKKLRYATEFFAALFPRKRTRVYRDALAGLQQVLGEWNDAAVAPRIAATIAGPAAVATVAIEAWAAGRASDAARRLDDAWAHFVAAKPFWSRV
ncbi:MAG: CHAD domain-containing protein [Burkholderiales bacterium]|nr:CHAD domain-containing protein [Burkholderiales bacterium]